MRVTFLCCKFSSYKQHVFFLQRVWILRSWHYLWYFLFNHLLDSSQYEFLQPHSCSSCWLDLFPRLFNLRYFDHSIIVVYFYFDIVSHVIIRANLLSWLQNVIVSRTQTIWIKHILLDLPLITSEVIKGSGLGSLLFILSINYIFE